MVLKPGRSKRGHEAYSVRYVECPSEPRTPLQAIFSILTCLGTVALPIGDCPRLSPKTGTGTGQGPEPVPYIFPANVGVTPAVFIAWYCKSGSFFSPNLQI